jgi:RNA polymerase sigma-70 factor (ECF subfamily)
MNGEKTARTPARARPVAVPLEQTEWQRLVAGDPKLFRRVYQEHVALVHYVAQRAGLASSDSEDVAQEAFTRLYARLGEIRGPDKLKAWLVTCARHLAIDRLRASRRHLLTDFAEPGGEALERRGPAALWQSGEEGKLGALRELELRLVGELLDRVAALPGGETLRQFYAEGLSTKEIARRNGEAVSTVTTRLSRLRARFREEFKSHIEGLRAQAMESG